MEPNEYGQVGAPQIVAPVAPEATPQAVAPVVPPPSDNMVTLPSAAQGQEQKVFEVKADDQVYQMTEEEVLRAASGGIHFTKQQQELAPYKEMRDFVENTPGVDKAIIHLMQNGMPQELGYSQPAASPYTPQAPQLDPTAQFLMQEVAGVRAELEQRDFTQRHPDADLNAVGNYMVTNNLPNLETAYKVLSFDDVQRQGAVAQQQNAQQRQNTALEPGAQGAPTQIQVDPRKLSHDEKSKIAAQHYNLIE
jgi:hypothetical protein